MTNFIETEGETVAEAIAKALEILGLSREEVEVEVLEEGNKGLLGLRKQAAKVRVQPKNNTALTAKETLKEMLSIVFPDVKVTERLVDDTIWLDVSAAATDFIGYHGQTLEDLQYLVRIMVSKKLNQKVKLVIDIDGYRERRKKSLETLAEKTVSKVISLNEPVELKPMSAFERRIVHSVVSQYKGVRSESTGEEPERRVVVLPA